MITSLVWLYRICDLWDGIRAPGDRTATHCEVEHPCLHCRQAAASTVLGSSMQSRERLGSIAVSGAFALGIVKALLQQRSRATDGASAPVSPDSSLHITSMAPDDAAAKAFVVQGYTYVIAAENKRATLPELDFVRAGLEAEHGGVLLCKTDDGKLVGYLWWLDTENCPYGPGCYADKPESFLWVHTVYTVPSHRRRGVARALHSELESVARRRKRGAIWLDVYANNPGSQQLHSKLGFEPVTVVQKKLVSYSMTKLLRAEPIAWASSSLFLASSSFLRFARFRTFFSSLACASRM